MSSTPENLVPLSALQHYIFCPRQCALIHVEQVWQDNLYTLRGDRAHERVDIPKHVAIGQLPYIQARLLARHIRGDLDEY